MVQGKQKQALTYFRKVTDNPRKMDRNDRPLLAAHKSIVNILFDQKKWKQVDVAYQTLLNNFQDEDCVKYEYSKFLLFNRQDYDKALQIIKDSLHLQCYSMEQVKTLIAAIYFTKWAILPDKTSKNAVDLKRNAETIQFDKV